MKAVAFDLNSQWGERYVIGLDLGQMNDSTAICAVRKLDKFPEPPVYQVGKLERLPLRMSYPDIVGYVTNMLARPRFRGKSQLVIDATGVGKPCLDLFQQVRGLNPIGIIITGGDTATREGSLWRVPKMQLVQRLTTLLQTDALHIHDQIPELPTLLREIDAFQVGFSATGHMTFNARSGSHDDCVLALSIACYFAAGDGGTAGPANWIEFMRRQSLGYAAEAAKLKPALVKLQRPKWDHTTNLITATSRNLIVPESGIVELNEEEARPLLAQGWTPVEAAA
jgi:hypothetical protein